MDPRRKVIILYASAGHGHEKAAKAILEAYHLYQKEADAEAFDILSFTWPFFGKSYGKFYLFLIRRLPWLWGCLYYGSDIHAVYVFLKPIRRFMNGLLLKRFERWLVAQNPSVIVSTHFMPTEVASHLKGNAEIRARLITVVTDYLPHYIWTAKNVDRYVVAIDETKEALMKRGVSEGKVSVLGIPIENKFLKKHSKEELVSKLNIDGQLFTVLLTSGGAGVGDAEKIIKGLLALKQRLQILVVCGTNKSLEENLKNISKNQPLLKPFGFVNTMDELMEVADIVVGKGGGLTITEAFAKEKPVILFQSVPGQEARNAFCVKRYGAGVEANSAEEVVRKVEAFVNEPAVLEGLKKAVGRIAKPRAAEAIMRLAEHG